MPNTRYFEISKLMETAGSWADWFGPAKARQWLDKAITSYKACPKLSKKHKADLAGPSGSACQWLCSALCRAQLIAARGDGELVVWVSAGVWGG